MPARVREIHRELLSKLEAERGPKFWALDRNAGANCLSELIGGTQPVAADDDNQDDVRL